MNMNKELIKEWCSSNIYLLNMLSSMINDAFSNSVFKDHVSLNFIGRSVPFEEEDVMYLEKVLTLLGYKDSEVNIDTRVFPLMRVSVNFSWSKIMDSEDWLFEFLTEERKKNNFWLEST